MIGASSSSAASRACLSISSTRTRVSRRRGLSSRTPADLARGRATWCAAAPAVRGRATRSAPLPENASVRHLTTLLAAMVLGAALIALAAPWHPSAAAMPALTLVREAGSSASQPATVYDATPPPGSDDPDRTHADPGAW